MSARWNFSLAACAAMFFCGALLATAAEPITGQKSSTTQGSPAIIRSSTLTGATVIDLQGQKLGQIKDVLLDSQAGQATFVVLDAAAPGTGHAMLVVPYRALWVSINPVDKRQSVVLDLRPDQLLAAPRIQSDQWQMLQNPQFLEQARSFYRVPTYAPSQPGDNPSAPYLAARPADSPSMTYSAARPIENPSMANPPIQYIAPPPCMNTGDSGWTRDLEDFYNE